MSSNSRLTTFALIAIAIFYFTSASANAQLWTPAEISSELWLDANDLSTITKSTVGPDELVSQWNDKSGNGRHVSEPHDSDKPIYQPTGFNGGAMPSLGFPDPGNQAHAGRALTVGGLSLPASDWALFAVIDDQSNDNENWLFVTTGTKENRYKLGTQGPEVRSDSGNGGSSNSATFVAGEQQLYMELSASNSQVLRDGTQVAADNGTYSPTTVSTFSVGARGNTGHAGINGAIAELVLLSTVPSQSDREIFEGYLAHKWGLEGSLPGAHPYKAAPPTIGGGNPHLGDANGDGTVDVADLGILATNWQMSGKTFAEGNFDGDVAGNVDVADLGILATHWQHSGPPELAASVSAVPEPATLALISLASVALLMRRRS